MRRRGFTLVELVVVMAITGVLAASVTMFLIPAIQSYFDTRRRADLTNMADTALRRMSLDIRRAVPNSVVSLQGGTCLALVPTRWGGRYRIAADGANDAGNTCTSGAASPCSAPLDDVSKTTFDVLGISPAAPQPQPGDFVVFDNQPGYVYAGSNRAAIAAGGYTTVVPNQQGAARITMSAAPTLPESGNGRFMVVWQNEQVIYYSCAGGTLFRNVTTLAAAGAGPSNAPCFAGDRVATAGTVACTFTFNSSNALVWMNLSLTQGGETVSLAQSTNVPNVP